MMEMEEKPRRIHEGKTNIGTSRAWMSDLRVIILISHMTRKLNTLYLNNSLEVHQGTVLQISLLSCS